MKLSAPLSVGIVGGSGYTGFELFRLLAIHPRVKITAVSSQRHTGKRISDVHQAFYGESSLNFIEFGVEFHKLDIVFLALPHGEGMPLVAELWHDKAGPKIIDLSSDFRLHPELYKRIYGTDHLYGEIQAQAIFGTPELSREEIASARLIANPGCFAHCIILALAPLALNGLLTERISVSAITGSTGSGATASDKTHHPARNENITAYQALSHRHLPEIEYALNKVSGNSKVRINFVPQSGPFSRGIFATCFVTLDDFKGDIFKIYRDFAAHNSFIRLRDTTPRLLDVRGSNFCDIALHQDGNTLVALTAIDNLVKGAAGNAVQCMNIIAGFDEKLGLNSLPLAI